MQATFGAIFRKNRMANIEDQYHRETSSKNPADLNLYQIIQKTFLLALKSIVFDDPNLLARLSPTTVSIG